MRRPAHPAYIPRRFRLGPHEIKVRIVSIETMRACNIAANGPKAESDEVPWGLWVAGENAILLQEARTCFSKDVQLATFWHEYFHALFDIAGESRLSSNEGLVERCAQLQMQMLRTAKPSITNGVSL